MRAFVARVRQPGRAGIVAGLALGLLQLGCAPKADQSGWEMARKKNPSERLESYPELPVRLPGPTALPTPAATGSALEATRNNALDTGSLFRRGFSAPTP